MAIIKYSIMILVGIGFIGFVAIPYSYALCAASLFGPPDPCFDSFSVSVDSPLTEKSIMENYARNIESNYPDWQMSDRIWDDEEIELQLPAIICTEFVADGMKHYRMAKWVDSHTISSFENHKDDSLCDKWLAPIDDGVKIKWDKPNYFSNDVSIVKVTDMESNLDDQKIDSFDIHVWSDTDHKGIELTITETGNSSGVFEGKVFFTTKDESRGNQLLVEDAVYADHKFSVGSAKIIREPETRHTSNQPDYDDRSSIPADNKEQVQLLSPLKQRNSGLNHNEIYCRDGQLLVLKNGRTFPACVNPDTVPKLFERNWALPEVPVIDLDSVKQESKTIKITGIINRFDTFEGFEYQFIPLRGELPRIAYSGYDTLNLFATSDTIHQFIRNIDGDLVNVQGSFLLDDDNNYRRHFSGFPIIPAETIKVISENQDLKYSIDGAKLVSITKIPDAITLNIVLAESQEGKLEIVIPCDMFDAKMENEYDDFFVLIDGKEVDFEEQRNGDERRLTIAFEENTTTIQVIGTFPI